MKTVRTLRGGSGFSGGTVAGATTFSAGVTVHEPFLVKDATEHTDFSVVNDPGLGPVVTIDGLDDNADKIILRANAARVEFYDNANALFQCLDGLGLYAGYGIVAGTPTLAAFYLQNDNGAGKLTLQNSDQTASFIVELGGDTLIWTHAAGSSIYSDAASGFLVIGTDGKTHTEIGYGKVIVYDGTGVFGAPIHTLTDTTLAFFGATPVAQQANITDASVAHAFNVVFSDTEVEAACNALGAKINLILDRLDSYGLTA